MLKHCDPPGLAAPAFHRLLFTGYVPVGTVSVSPHMFARRSRDFVGAAMAKEAKEAKVRMSDEYCIVESSLLFDQ